MPPSARRTVERVKTTGTIELASLRHKGGRSNKAKHRLETDAIRLGASPARGSWWGEVRGKKGAKRGRNGLSVSKTEEPGSKEH